MEDHLRRRAAIRIGGGVAECARRFRYEKETILDLAATLRSLGARSSLTICSTPAAPISISGDLAQPVEPRFGREDLMLPPKQTRQLHEIIQAMRDAHDGALRMGHGARLERERARGAVRRPARHRQDDGGGGHRRRARPAALSASTSRRS